MSLIPLLLYGASFGEYESQEIAQYCRITVPYLAMGIVFLIHISFPTSSVWSLSLSLNVIFTVVIVLRILLYRRRIVRALGSAHGKQYLTIAAMIIESASIFTVAALIFIITYVVNHPIQYFFGQILSQMQASVYPMLRDILKHFLACADR